MDLNIDWDGLGDHPRMKGRVFTKNGEVVAYVDAKRRRLVVLPTAEELESMPSEYEEPVEYEESPEWMAAKMDADEYSDEEEYADDDEFYKEEEEEDEIDLEREEEEAEKNMIVPKGAEQRDIEEVERLLRSFEEKK